MKRNFKFYVIAWAIFLAIYNLTVFFARPLLPGYEFNYDARFWVSWSIVIVTFIGHLFCAGVAFNAKNKEKLFLNMPLITGSYTALILCVVISSAVMLIPDCPYWISVIVCVATLGFSAISILKATVAADLVDAIDTKIKAQTFFIKSLTVDADTLLASAKSDIVKAECKKVYEAVRYSDPMSSEMLASVEGQITIKFATLTDAVKADDATAVSAAAEEVLILIKDRNNKCKLLK